MNYEMKSITLMAGVRSCSAALSWSGHNLDLVPNASGLAQERFMLQRLTKELNLTSEQQTKVEPIIDQAKPQIAAIHQEAMPKIKAVMDSTMSQIRPLLTPDQPVVPLPST